MDKNRLKLTIPLYVESLFFQGQSEIEVKESVDLLILMIPPGGGDDLEALGNRSLARRCLGPILAQTGAVDGEARGNTRRCWSRGGSPRGMGGCREAHRLPAES